MAQWSVRFFEFLEVARRRMLAGQFYEFRFQHFLNLTDVCCANEVL